MQGVSSEVVDLRPPLQITPDGEIVNDVATDELAVASVETRANRPLRRWVRTAVVGDLVIGLLATNGARLLRFGTEDVDVGGDGVRVSYLAIGIIVTALWPVFNAFAGSYDYRASLFGIEEVRRVIRSGIALLCTLAISYFALKLSVSRAYALILVPGLVLATALWRLALRRQLSRRRARGIDRHRAVVVGPLEDVHRVCIDLTTRPSSPIELVAYHLDDADDAVDLPAVLGKLRRLEHRDEITDLQRAGERIDLLLRAGQPYRRELWSLARQAHESRVAMAISPARSDAINVGFSYLPLGSTPLLMVETPSLKPAHLLAKLIFDRAAAALLLLILGPALLAIAAAIAVVDGRPVAFRQTRVGKDGAHFRVIKFRTMAADAEARVDELSGHNIASGPLFKVKEDPRVTRVGRLLRRSSLDELPQLINVLRGEMSLVGPRPPLPSEVAKYDERTARRLLVRPGMTGLWQVSGRSDLGWDEGIYLDVLYVDHWSPLLDIAIIARTLVTIVRPRGAY